MANCLWNDFEGHGKIHLASWKLVNLQKKHGGMGVPDLRDLNLVLLGSWIKRFLKDVGKLWYNIITQKCVRNAVNIFSLPHSNSSVFWRGVLWAAKALKFGYRWVVGDGTKVRFWEDIWFGTAPLATQFWDLFCICDQIGVSLASVWDGVEVKLTFRRNFSEDMMERWFELSEIISSVVYNDGGGCFSLAV